MNREYTVERYRELIDRGRELMPDLALSTDIIVGFPGETAEEFEETYRAMESIRFDSAFMFKYSPRRGTVAAGLPDDVAPEEKQRRLARIIEFQRRVTEEQSARFVGRTVEVLVEGPSNRDSGRVVGKTREFKNAVFPGDPAWAGTLRTVSVQESRGVTLTGVPLDPSRAPGTSDPQEEACSS
jgi:tRNA-2-methylthio-N6-dimethylallyladenosine synthase